jgi:hypothetical protein
MMSTEELNTSISLTCGTNPHPVPIAHKEVHTSHKTLGIQLCPKGTMTAETSRLKDRVSALAAAVTTLSSAQVHSIQIRSIRATLGSLGVNRMFPSDVAHGPLTHCGLGLPHLLTIQGTAQIALLAGHIRQKDVNGKLTLACLETAQLIAGVIAPILENPTISYPHLKVPWLDSHQSFLIPIAMQSLLSPQRGLQPYTAPATD